VRTRSGFTPADGSVVNAAVFERRDGTSPLVISLPHVGTAIPQDIHSHLTPAARALTDTDWHVDRLYEFAHEAGDGWLRATHSRYVIDLNRPPQDGSLYPGQTTTSLVPTETFAGEPLYAAAAPTADEIHRRRKAYWQPYHTALQEMLAAARTRFGYALLLDAHSIRSQVPRLFSGRLPDVNLGTNDGRSSDPRLVAELMAVLERQSRVSFVLNGRFKGGYITRAYGQPSTGVYGVQIELAQSAYMDEAGTGYETERAAPLVELLRSLIDVLRAFSPVTRHGP
jgi:N-formylglutamate deformylase